MKHQKKGRKFGREKNQRAAFMKSLAVSLISRGKIKTTVERAKSLRPHVERLITLAKKGSASAKYSAVNKFLPKAPAHKLVSDIAPKYVDRHGGYTRIIKMPRRKGDAAHMAVIEFV